MALGELGHDPRGRGADVVDVELGLGQPGDVVGRDGHFTALRTALTAVPGSGCILSSMKTPGVPLTPSSDIWSVAFVTHCS